MTFPRIPTTRIRFMLPPGLALFALILAFGASRQPSASAQEPVWTASLSSPKQTVEAPDETGRLRRARFEASAQTNADGTARGMAFLLQGGDKLEYRFERVTSLVVESGIVRRLVMEGHGTRTSGGQGQEFSFVATIQPSAIQDDLIWDLKDGFVTPSRAFSAQGTLQIQSP